MANAIRRRSWRRRHSKQRSGLVTVEFALCASLLFLLFLTSIDYARANLIRHVVNNAAFEAARSSIFPGATPDSVRDKANAMLAIGYVQDADIQVTPFVDSTETVTVTISVPMASNQWVLSKWFEGKSFVRESTVAREDY